MAIVSLKIHPAIGVARLGNSPDEFFVGPERLWDPPDPPGGFKDTNGRVKRQAARFRVFAYHDDGSVKELTAADATITWTVQLANKKAVLHNVDGACQGASCTPSEPGQYTVTATAFAGDAEVRGEAMLVVEPQPKPLARLRLDPADATIILGASQSYTARGLAEDGTDLGDYTATASFATARSDPSADLVIDPKPRCLVGPGQRQAFNDGQIRFPGAAAAVTVPLGEMRTDDEGRLLVLGGFGISASPTGKPIEGGLTMPGWYDDVSDGPVTATVRLHGTEEDLPVVGAWVLVGPPKFAPQLENVITLYDAVFQMGVDQGWRTRPEQPSYTNDIYPILQRARTMRWVIEIPSRRHTWADPVYQAAKRQAIFRRITDPTGDAGPAASMPLLNSATLTATQYAAMLAWKDDNFIRDWTTPPVPSPQVTPEELDRAALTGCVGASFSPGIEAGGFNPQPIVEPTRYLGGDDPMRLDHSKVSPGDLTEHMALPWQADFAACGHGWWPVPRPSEVVPQTSATGEYVGWDRDVQSSEAMVRGWHSLGFVLRQGDRYLEVDHSPTTLITLVTPHLDFQDVPQGPMAMSQVTSLAIEFEVRSPGAAVTLELEPGDGPVHPRLKVDPATTTVGPTVEPEITTARLWVSYETGQVDEHTSDQVTVWHAESSRTWTVTITANTVTRQAAAAALVLDRSALLAEDRGVGRSSYQRLAEAASIFVDLMPEGDAVALVPSNQETPAPLAPVGPTGDPVDSTRRAAKDALSATEAARSAATSVDDGIRQGRQLLEGAEGRYDKTLIVLTDGKQDRPTRRSPIAGGNERVFTVGLETPEGTSMQELQAISENSGGYLLATGPSTGASRFLPQKHLLQILAGISGAEVALDVEGTLVAGSHQQLPFLLTEADAGLDVILLTDSPQEVDLRLQTPIGFVLAPWRAAAEPSMAWLLSQGVSAYRVRLPAELQPLRYERAGTWQTLLSIGQPQDARPDDRRASGRHGPARIAAGAQQRRLPYRILVHTYSNLSLRAAVLQSGHEPGAPVTVEAAITQAGMPMVQAASVWVEVARPDGSASRFDFAGTDPGRFTGSFPTSVAGVYRCRVRASGRSRAGYPFQREQLLTAAVWRSGDPNRARAGEDDG
jgi:L-Lysine epsilon oxidase N-terminal/L-lysine epsilon oxidase C-terminal domain/von Willebrand factor type A domain